MKIFKENSINFSKFSLKCDYIDLYKLYFLKTIVHR